MAHTSIHIPFPKIFLAPNPKSIHDINISLAEAGQAIIILQFVLASFDNAIFCAMKQQYTGKRINEKRKNTGGNNEAEENDDGNAAADDHGEDISSKFYSRIEPENIDRSLLLMKFQNDGDHDVVEFLENFQGKLPRILLCMHYIGKNASIEDEETYLAYDNMSGIIISFYVIDPDLKLNDLFGKQLRQNKIDNKNATKRRGRSFGQGNEVLQPNLLNYDKLHQHVENSNTLMTFTKRIMNTGRSNGVRGVRESREWFDMLNFADALKRMEIFDRRFITYDERMVLDESSNVLLQRASRFSIWQMDVDNLNPIKFNALYFPWRKYNSNTSQTIRLMLNMTPPENQAAARELAAFGCMTIEQQLMMNNNYYIEDKLISFRKETDSKRKKDITETTDAGFYGDDWIMNPISESYRKQHGGFISEQIALMENEFQNSNILLPKAYSRFFIYKAEVEREKLHVPSWISLDAKRCETPLTAFAQHTLSFLIQSNTMGLSSFSAFSFHEIWLNMMSVYILNDRILMANNTIVIGLPGTGKSHTQGVYKKILIKGTIQPFGSQSTLARNQALEGSTREIYSADEATEVWRAESQTDLAPLNARLGNGTTTWETTIEDPVTGGRVYKKTIVRCCEMYLLNCNSLLSSPGNNNKDTAKAFIDRFRIIDGSVKDAAGCLPSFRKALRRDLSDRQKPEERTAIWLQMLQACFMYYFGAGTPFGIIRDPPTDLTRMLIDTLFANVPFFKNRGVSARNASVMMNTCSLMQISFAADYVTRILHAGEPMQNLFCVDVMKEIAQCAIGRIEIITYVLAGEMFRLENGDWYSLMRTICKKSDSRVQFAMDSDILVEKLYPAPVAGLIGRNLADYNKNWCTYVGDSDWYVRHFTEAGGTLIHHYYYTHEMNTVGGRSQRRWETISHQLSRTRSSDYVIPKNMEDCLIENNQTDLSFETIKIDGKDYINPNYLFVSGNMIHDYSKGKTGQIFQAGGITYTSQQVEEILKKLKNSFFSAPYAPMFEQKSVPALHVNFLRSIHWHVYFSGPNKQSFNTPIVKECENGFLILIKWLDSSPEDIITRILKTLCYNGTRNANSVIYSPHPECRLTYNTFQFEPIKKSLVIPATKDVEELTYFASELTMGAFSEEDIEKILHEKRRAQNHNFFDTDIEKQTAFAYWMEHFPEKDPNELWAKFSPAAVDEAIAKTQLHNHPYAEGKCYPHSIFDIPTDATQQQQRQDVEMEIEFMPKRTDNVRPKNPNTHSNAKRNSDDAESNIAKRQCIDVNRTDELSTQ